MARLENLLGAQVLAFGDLLTAADEAVHGPIPDSERAGVVTVLTHPGILVSELGDILGLTSSGVTRLVTRLVDHGWVTRTTGRDARRRELHVTRTGSKLATSILTVRNASLAAVLRRLPAADRQQLEQLLETLLDRLAGNELGDERICRLCDRGTCAGSDAGCPLGHRPLGDQGSASTNSATERLRPV